MPILIFFGMIWLSGGFLRAGWLTWLIVISLIFYVVPAVIRMINRQISEQAEFEKRKREEVYDDAVDEYGAKPKREPRYILGDDGELIEVQDDEDKPKRSDFV